MHGPMNVKFLQISCDFVRRNLSKY